MLQQRIITALLLLALLVPALLASTPWPFAFLTLLLIGAAGWEWMRLNGASSVTAMTAGVGLALMCGLAMVQGGVPIGTGLIWWIALAVWLLGGSWALYVGPGAWSVLPRSARWCFGLALLWAAWLALANAKVIGVNYVLSIFGLVWVADISAYFGGKSFGRTKLAPTISPGKTWEGVCSGLVGVMVLAGMWMLFDRASQPDSLSLYTILLNRVGLTGLLVALLLLTAMSVVGDLFESLVKRSAGAKDSSGLLPGHGGVLDRIDALLPVFPIAMALRFI